MTAADRKAPERLPGRVRLGLIGDNIRRSRSPDLHRLAGQLTGLDVSYDLFIPRDMGKDFDQVFEACRAARLRGVNVTYPYKEQAASLVVVDDPLIRSIGAVNTVVFDDGRASGHNTDYSGFIAAFRQSLPGQAPGRVVMIGAGGVGRAVAFGLIALGAEALTIVDHDRAKAEALADAVTAASVGKTPAEVAADVGTATRTADGIVNCTPVGMVGHPGSPIDLALLGGQRWAFEAIYTPRRTEFSLAAAAAGLTVIGGYELFIHQGLDAFRIFTGRSVDERALRAALSE